MTGNHRDDEPSLWVSCFSSCLAVLVAVGVLALVAWGIASIINHLLK